MEDGNSLICVGFYGEALLGATNPYFCGGSKLASGVLKGPLPVSRFPLPVAGSCNSAVARYRFPVSAHTLVLGRSGTGRCYRPRLEQAAEQHPTQKRRAAEEGLFKKSRSFDFARGRLFSRIAGSG